MFFSSANELLSRTASCRKSEENVKEKDSLRQVLRLFILLHVGGPSLSPHAPALAASYYAKLPSALP